MKTKIILISCMSALLLSCSVKKESKEVDIPKPKTGRAQEILDNMYSSNVGFECDLQDDNSDTTSKVFYIDRSKSDDDNKLVHKFYTIKKDSEKVGVDINIGEFNFWLVFYSDMGDELFNASTPTSKKESDGKIYKTNLSFDNKTNSFNYKIVREEFENSTFVEKEIVESGSIVNCIEATYKIFKGLD